MAADRPIQIVLLTREDCALCEDARVILERLASEVSLAVTTVDFDSEAGRRFALSGGLLFPPGIVIEGRPFCYGRPSERKLRRELAALATSAVPAAG